jgi:hypothetical protein
MRRVDRCESVSMVGPRMSRRGMYNYRPRSASSSVIVCQYIANAHGGVGRDSLLMRFKAMANVDLVMSVFVQVLRCEEEASCRVSLYCRGNIGMVME